MSQNKTNLRPGWSLEERDPKFIESIMPLLEWLYKYYFRVKTDGWHHIPKQEKVLFVGSHNGGLSSPDTSMMMYDWFRLFGTERLVYGLMHPIAWQVYSNTSTLAAKAGAIIAHPKTAFAAFEKGASVLVYPGGAQDVFRPYVERDKICFAERRGFIKLALKAEVPIVPVISKGAHDTLFVLTDFYQIMQQFHQWGMPWLFDIDPLVFPIYFGLPWGLAVGPLPNIPLPTQIHTRICPPIVFDRYGKQAASDRSYVDDCYDLVQTKMQQELDCLFAEDT